MKSMKLWMGVAAALVMGTGCGGTSPEDACGEYENSLKQIDKNLAACSDDFGGLKFAAFYNEAACVQGLENCSSDDLDNALSQLDCVVDVFKCEAFETEAAAAAAEAKIEACEAKFKVSASCDGPAVAVGENSAPRKALKLLRSR